MAVARRAREWTLVVMAAAAGAYLAMTLFSATSVTVSPFELGLAARPSLRGVTEVSVPPLGRVRAPTHLGPIALSVRVETVDVRDLARLVETADQERLLAELRGRLVMAARRFAVRLLVLGVLGGALAALALPWGPRPPRRVVAGALVGLLWGAGTLVAADRTFDPAAFRHARYSGAISAAPWLLDAFASTPERVQAFSRQMDLLTERLYALYRGLDVVPSGTAQDGALRVLIVSDLHNNPAGVRLVREFAATFAPDLVIDAGDVSDWGTAPEAELVAGLSSLPVPYFVAPGNHDSPTSLRALVEATGARLLEDLAILPGGLLVITARDPSSFRTSPALASPEELAAQSASLEALLAAAPRRPDLLVVHNPAVAERFVGRVPVVVSGHTHVQRVDDSPRGLFLNPGSTGAAGIRGLMADREIPYGLLLLTLVPGRDGGWQPVSVDAVEVYRLESTGFALQRYVVDGRPETPVSPLARPPQAVYEELPLEVPGR
ncbi:MAG: metallophosphoesterase [Bacillota bacterium]|nr:MAG: metallophosphoesterase [Bacillota bacterium]